MPQTHKIALQDTVKQKAARSSSRFLTILLRAGTADDLIELLAVCFDTLFRYPDVFLFVYFAFYLEDNRLCLEFGFAQRFYNDVRDDRAALFSELRLRHALHSVSYTHLDVYKRQALQGQEYIRSQEVDGQRHEQRKRRALDDGNRVHARAARNRDDRARHRRQRAPDRGAELHRQDQRDRRNAELACNLRRQRAEREERRRTAAHDLSLIHIYGRIEKQKQGKRYCFQLNQILENSKL